VRDVDGFRIVAFDSEWLLRESDALAAECGGTFAAASATFWTKMTEAMLDPGVHTIILASHHPIRSHGPHGRRPVASPQDLTHPRYQRLISRTNTLLTTVLRQRRDLTVVHAAGHEHTLEVIADTEFPTLTFAVSGSASKRSSRGADRDTLFSQSTFGYLMADRVQTAEGTRTFLEGISADGKGRRLSLFSRWLPQPEVAR